MSSIQLHSHKYNDYFHNNQIVYDGRQGRRGIANFTRILRTSIKKSISLHIGIKHYDKAFKENAVKLSYQRESLSSLSREIGVSVSQLSKWRKDFAQYGSLSFQGRGVERLSDHEISIRDLEKELRNSKLELEILKKAIAVFSKIDQ